MLSIEEAFKQVERFQKAHKGLEKVPFIVVDTQENAFPNASEEWHKENTVTGAYLPADNIVVVVANNNRDMEELNKTLRHEVFGHLALNRLNEFDKMDLLESIANAPKDSEVGIHRDMLLANEYSNLKNDPLRLAEEVYAHTAERSFETINHFISVPDPKQINSEKDLLGFIGSLKNGIHHGVLKQQIFPKENNAQFKIKEQEAKMKKNIKGNKMKKSKKNNIMVIRQGKIKEIPKKEQKSNEVAFDSIKEAIIYQVASGSTHNFTNTEKQILADNFKEITSKAYKNYSENVKQAKTTELQNFANSQNISVVKEHDNTYTLIDTKNSEELGNGNPKEMLKKIEAFCKNRDAKQKAPEKSQGMER